MNIAIDGPAGAGKSTAAKLIAKKLNILYLDTGAMYRAIGLKVLRAGINPCDAAAVERILPSTTVDVRHEGGAQKVFLDGEDVSTEIRRHEVSKYASDVSAVKGVRLKMVELQREIAKKTDAVLDGRDIGTFVLPNAEYKFYLTASADERAKRRYLELKAKGAEMPLEKIKADIETRDYNDSHRDFAPLKKADDAIEIDSSLMDENAVADRIINIIKRK